MRTVLAVLFVQAAIGAGSAAAQGTNPAPPGAPGVITEGSSNVSIGGQPAARKGDQAAGEGGIVGGSSNVFINGKPAATTGDRTGCGGVTVGGGRRGVHQRQAGGARRRSHHRLSRQVRLGGGSHGQYRVAVEARPRPCLARRCLGSRRASAPSSSPASCRSCATPRNAFYRAGDYAQSLRFAERALPLFIRELGPDHEQTGIQYYSLGLIAEAVGNLAAWRSATTPRPCACARRSTAPTAPAWPRRSRSSAASTSSRAAPIAAEPMFRRALKLKQDLIGFRHVFAASGHANLGDVALARGNWPAALASYREAISLLTGQDTSQTVVKPIVDDEIRRYRDTFVGLCRAAWQTQGGRHRRGRAGGDVPRGPAGLEHLGGFRARQDDGAARRRQHGSRPAHPRACRTCPSASCASTPTTRSC